MSLLLYFHGFYYFNDAANTSKRSDYNYRLLAIKIRKTIQPKKKKNIKKKLRKRERVGAHLNQRSVTDCYWINLIRLTVQ